MLSILAGSVWGIHLGLLIAIISTTLGSTIAYILSSFIVKGCILKTFKKSVVSFANKIEENKNNLLYYTLFIRISPLFPNMLVNVASPIAGIPLKTYILATFIGLIPINYIHI